MAIVSSWPTRSPQGQPFSSSVIGQGVLQHEGFGLEHLELPKRTGDRGEALPLQHVTGLSSTRWRAAPSDSRTGLRPMALQRRQPGWVVSQPTGWVHRPGPWRFLAPQVEPRVRGRLASAMDQSRGTFSHERHTTSGPETASALGELPSPNREVAFGAGDFLPKKGRSGSHIDRVRSSHRVFDNSKLHALVCDDAAPGDLDAF